MPTSPDTPDRDLIVYCSALGLPETEAAYGRLLRAKGVGVRRQLFTDQKFDGRSKVRIQNLNGGYPTEPVDLRNVVTQAFGRDVDGDLLHDGLDLLCLNQILARDGADGIVLMRSRTAFQAPVQRWLSAPPDLPFFSLDDGPDAARTTAFRRDHPGLRALVGLATELFQSGAVFALEHYSLDTVLHTAWAAARRL